MDTSLKRARASSFKLATEKLASTSPQKKCLFGLVIVLLLVAIGLALFSIFLNVSRDLDNVDFFNSNEQWRKTCDRKCDADFKVPPLLLISMDGFRASYLERNITPAIQKLSKCGTSAPYMFPSFPSKTFPNHYTLATGLYPESHGIVANSMFDMNSPNCKNNTEKSNFPRCAFFNSSVSSWWFYQGEPIWNTVMNERKKTATFFWPGSYFPINGKMPDYAAPYNVTIPFSSRVDQVIKWLSLPEAERPSFMTMYFHQPDLEGHSFGPDSDQVNSQLIYVDAMLNYLLSRLDQQGMLGCINIVLVSDHGMQVLKKDKRVPLFEDFPLPDPEQIRAMGDTTVNVQFRDTNKTDYLAAPEVRKLLCKKGEKYKVFSMDTMPRRMHYAGSKRIGQLIIDANIGYCHFHTKDSYDKFLGNTGNHGFDNREASMRAVFAAYGPGFKKNHVVKPFQNIELYNLMSDAMGLSRPAPNNGTYGALFDVLVNPPEYPAATHRDFAACEDQNLLTCGDSCHFELPLPDAAVCYPSHGLGLASNALQGLCRTVLCNATVVLDRTLAAPVVVEALLMDRMSNLDHRANCSLKLDSANDTDCSKKPSGKASISLFPDNNYLWFLEQARIPAGPEFVGGIWKEFGKLVLKYQRHYKTLRLFAGPVFDRDNDGLADGARQGPPTHVFIVLLRCSFGSEWDSDYAHCKTPEDSRVLSFVLPLTDKNDNCLHPAEYLYTHSARVRDIELLTGLEFFTNRERYSDALAIELRTFISQSIWQLEQQVTS